MRFRSSSVLLSLFLASPALADEAPDADADSILVTATRIPTSGDQMAMSFTVLDRADIDRAQDFDVGTLVARTPSISLTRNGGYGTATQLRIRGAETDQTVVVIDGVKLNDPSSTGGGYNFANMLVGDIARVEILRGPQSILWGSQAIGGVVNVETALPPERLEGAIDLEGGSRDTVSARAALGGRNGPVGWRFSAQSFSTGGISALAPAFGGREKDGYSNRSLSGRVDVALAQNVKLDLRGYFARGTVDIDGFAVDSPEYSVNRDLVGYAGISADFLDGRFHNRIGYAYTDTSRDSFDPRRQRQKSFDANGHNERVEYQGSFAFTDRWTLLFGAENERSHFDSVSPSGNAAIPIPEPARGNARINSVYGQLRGEILPGLTLNGGIRYDDHNRFGGNTLFSGGGVWALPTGTRIRASYGEGFKAPTLYQLFSEYGNVTLRPERSKSWEAGIEQGFLNDALSLSATWFDRTDRDGIVYNGCTGAPDPMCFVPGTETPRWGYYLNVARAKTRGVEVEARGRIGESWILDANYSWVEALDRSGGASDGNWLPRRPHHSANGSIAYVWPFRLETGVAVRWVGKSYDDAANRTSLDSYTLVDLRAEVPVGRGVSIYGRVENLLDKDYMTIYRYGTLGRSFYAGVRGRF